MLVIRTKEYNSYVNFVCRVTNDGRRWNLKGRSRKTYRQLNYQIDWIRVLVQRLYKYTYICVYMLRGLTTKSL